mmetsp:Transcript_28520/g.48742  ORF Transcript_28520/g.48742 Transcript_28520/m.48742 type:complete len:166 (+) Transcript_28520:46-543(+)
MVAIDSIPSQNRTAMVESLFTDNNAHRFSQERLETVLWWTGALENKESIFLANYEFLKKVWSDNNFRPFDNVKSSTLHLSQHPDQDFLIRLSTSQQGGITLTFRRALGTNRIVHTRFQVNSNSNIIDPNGKEHSTISSLVNWFSNRGYKHQKATPAGYICNTSMF